MVSIPGLNALQPESQERRADGRVPVQWARQHIAGQWGTVNKGMKTGIAAVALTPLLALGLSSAFGTSKPGPAGTAGDASDHPECYDEARLNNANDFCYRTMGPGTEQHPVL
jgi:hypothetical protein